MTLVHYRARGPYAWEVRRTQPTSCASSMEVVSAPEVTPPESDSLFVRGFISFSYIQTGNRRFALSRELMPLLKQEGALWSCELEDLHIMGYGYTREQAIQQFMDDFVVTYDGLADKKDDQLTEDSRELRDAMRTLVARITLGAASGARRVLVLQPTTGFVEMAS